ncbi:MAG: response regulator [Desulfohalobiaceae bacterium]
MPKNSRAADAKKVSSTTWWFIVSVAITILLILLLIANLYFSFSILSSLKRRDLIAERASWQLLLHAENMDKAARVSTLSGNLQWKDAYQKSHLSLEEIMQKISRVAAGVVSPEKLQNVHTYIQNLKDLENQVYDLVSIGNKDHALQILDGWEYTRNQQAFKSTTTSIVESIQQNIQDKIDRYNKLALGFLLIILFCLTLLLSFWGVTFRLWRAQVRLKQAAEENLRHSEEKYKKLIDTSPDSIALVDEDGHILAANPVMGKQLGLEQKDLEGMTLQDVLPQEQAHQIMQHGTQALSQREPVHLQEKSQDKYFENYYVPVFALQAKDSFQLVSKDITERKHAEQEKERLRSQMLQAQKMQSIGILAGGVAHEFNNLLQVMGGNTQLLLQQKSTQDPEYKRLKNIEKAIQRAAQFIRQLLLFSRKSETNRQIVDLRHGVKEAVHLLQQTIPRMVQVECNLEQDLWPIYADPIHIEQVVLNLGKNAADAMPDGGRIEIQAKNVQLSNECARNDSGPLPGEHVLLQIQDTGCGMQPQTLEQMFEPFFTTKEVGSGTGLGLSTVYGIVQIHSGHIECQSQPGQGTIFSIYWPSQHSQEESKEQQEILQPSGGSETILVVDDESAYRTLLQEALSQYGYTLLTASSGEEALQIYHQESRRIDLVILDLSMSGMGGKKCLQELLRKDPKARVLVASGYSAEVTGQDILQKGAAGFLGKPFQLSELFTKIREVLNNHQVDYNY